MQNDDFHQCHFARPRFRRRNSGFTLVELMVVVGIIGIMAAIGFARQESCRGELKNITITLANDIVAARQSARSNNVTVNFYFGTTAATAAGVPGLAAGTFGNSWYVRHLDLNGNLQWNPGEDVFLKHMTCTGDAQGVIEFGPPTGPGNLVDPSGTHTPEADGINLVVTSPAVFPNVLSFSPSGVANTLTPGTDTLFLRVASAYSSNGVGRALVVRLNGKTLLYGYDPGMYKTNVWVPLR